jgi:hypothetical protein
MELFSAVGGLVSVLVSWIVGLRLIFLARRTRQAPELLVGLGLFLVGGWWSPLVAVGRQATGLSDGARAALVCAGGVTAIAGMLCLALFTYRVFRPGTTWAKALVATMGLALIGVFVAQTFGSGWGAFARSETGWWRLATWIGVTDYFWANAESWRQYWMLSRRQRLGLADPIVTDRLRLWSLALSTAVAASILLAVCQTMGIGVAGTQIGLLTTVVVALISATCLWLAFLPPASYLARVRRLAGDAS